MFSLGRKCEDLCGPHNASRSTASLLFHALPFLLTFVVISLVVLHRLFPILCGTGSRHHYGAPPESRLRKRIAAFAFSTTLGATGVLAELILCEVSDWVNAEARRMGFRVTVSVLLVCLIVVTPALEIASLVEASAVGKWKRRNQLLVMGAMFVGWLWLFWNVGDVLPMRRQEFSLWQSSRTLSEECLARVGVVGVSLMALLSGFGCVSTPFSGKHRHVSETDVARAQSGLEAAHDMLESKRNQLRILEKRIHDKKSAPQEGIMSKVISTIRNGGLDSDSLEHTTLLNEISGLETMTAALSTKLSDLQHIRHSQTISRTLRGRIFSALYFVFSLYCLYRIAATTFAHLPLLHRRSTSTSYSQTDPITNLLALLAKHWDPHLDRAAWSRQIGFLLSGVIIAGSLTSVLSTLRMLSRAAPAVLVRALKQDSSPGFALLVSQLCAVYVLAAALLLRSNLPPYMSSVITESLGAPLDTQFVEKWFDALFLSAAALTGVGIVVVRKWKRIAVDEELEEWESAGKEC